MITSIRLVNWRSHNDTHLEFSKGTNLLVGIMGAGKSAVLDSVSFALFGTFPVLERRRVKLDDIVRFNENQASVILEMRWNGHNYRVERTISRKEKRTTSKAEIFRDGSLIDSGSTAVTMYVEQLLGVDYDLFTRAIYSEQNNIDYFLTLDPRKRKEEIDRLLGLDKFEAARGNIVSVINRVLSNKKILGEKFDMNAMEEMEKLLENYKAESEKLGETLEKIKTDYEKKAKEAEETGKKFENLMKTRERYERIETEMTKIRGMLESLEPELKEKISEDDYNRVNKQLEETKKQLEETKKEGKESESKRSALTKEIGSIDEQVKNEIERKGRIEKLEKALDELLGEKKPAQLSEELKNLKGEELRLHSELKSLKDEIEETKETLGKLKPGMANCPLCGNGLDEKGLEHIEKEKKALVEKKSSGIRDIEGKTPEIKKKIEALDIRIRKIEFAGEKISALEKEAKNEAELRKKKKELDNELKTVNERIELRESRFSEIRDKAEKLRFTSERYGQILERKKKAMLLKDKGKELGVEKKGLDYDEKSFEETRAALENKKLEKQKLESDGNAAKQQFNMIKENAEVHEKRINEMKGIEKEIGELSKLSEELKIYKNALLDTQITLRKSLIEAINAAMNEVWEIFYPYKNYSTVRLGVTEKDYVFEVHERGEWKPLETVASGGERACAALTLRVALATVLTPNLSWLILDEPTHNLDKEAVSLLSETLQLKVPQVVNQTFVITHEEGLIGADFAASYKLSRNKEENGPTKTENI